MTTKYKNVSIVATGPLTIEKPNGALAFLAGVCEHNNVQYKIFDANVYLRQQMGIELWNYVAIKSTVYEKFRIDDDNILQQINQAIADAVDQLLTTPADLVALTSFSSEQIPMVKRFLEILKTKSSVTVIAGGPGIIGEITPGTTFGKFLLERNLIDYYCLGEGDQAFGNFLKGTIDLGINSRDNLYESWVPQLNNLDVLPTPSYKNMDVDQYEQKHIVLSGSRGCVRDCSFCNVGVLWEKFRFKSAKTIVQEILKHHRDTGITKFTFSDSLVNGSLKQFRELMTEFGSIKQNYPELQAFEWTGTFIIREAQQHPESLFELIGKSGCSNLIVGIESASEQVRIHMKKAFSDQAIAHHIKMCSKYKIGNTLLWITGYPTETLEDHNKTVQFFRDYQKYIIDDTIISNNIFQPFLIIKDTPIDAMRDELGIHIKPEDYGSSYYAVDSNPELTMKEKFRRYIELAKLSIELKYPGASMDITSLAKHINYIKSL